MPLLLPAVQTPLPCLTLLACCLSLPCRTCCLLTCSGCIPKLQPAVSAVLTKPGTVSRLDQRTFCSTLLSPKTAAQLHSSN